jgi:hypothetical protein
MFFGEHVCGPECDGEKGCLAARKERGRVDRVKEAKKLCAECMVREECLAYAVAGDEKFGIWGGLTERERKRMKREAKNGNQEDDTADDADREDDMASGW